MLRFWGERCIMKGEMGKELLPKHLLLAYRIALGDSTESVAEELGMELRVVETILESPMMKEEVDRIRLKLAARISEAMNGDEVERLLQGSAPLAVRKLIEQMLQNADRRTSAAAAKDILKLAGYEKPKEIDVSHEFHLPDAQAELLSQTLMMMRRRREEAGDLVEAEVVDVRALPARSEGNAKAG